MPTYPFIDKGIAWTSDTIKCSLLKDTYSIDLTHEFWDDVSSHEVSGTNYAAATLTCTESFSSPFHTFDASDPSWTAITVEDARYAVVWKDTGTPSTSPLMFIFELDATYDPVNADCSITWPSIGLYRQTYE